MYILGIDCAIKNIGISYIEFDNNYEKKINAFCNLMKLELNKKILSVKYAIDILKKINDFLKQIIRIIYINTFDLIPNDKFENTNFLKRSAVLKTFLYNIDEKYPRKDIILIEYQMGINEVSHCIASQIMYHYSDIIDVKFFPKNMQIRDGSYFTYNLNKFPMNECNVHYQNTKSEIHYVSPSIKNNIQIVPDGKYCYFIEKYTNYVANKKHTEYNFIRFMEIFGYLDGETKLCDFLNTRQYNKKNGGKTKMDDSADAFMMIIAWIRNKLC